METVEMNRINRITRLYRITLKLVNRYNQNMLFIPQELD